MELENSGISKQTNPRELLQAFRKNTHAYYKKHHINLSGLLRIYLLGLRI